MKPLKAPRFKQSCSSTASLITLEISCVNIQSSVRGCIPPGFNSSSLSRGPAAEQISATLPSSHEASAKRRTHTKPRFKEPVSQSPPGSPPAAPQAVTGSEQLILDKGSRARLAGPVQTQIHYVPKSFLLLSLVTVGPIPTGSLRAFLGAVSRSGTKPRQWLSALLQP